MRTQFLGFLLVLLAVGSVTAQTPGTGSISGRIQSADGRGLRAMVKLQSAPAANVKPVTGRVASGSDGSFHFSGIASGNYSLCAQPIGGQGRNADEIFIDSCEWNMPQSVPPLAPGQALSNVVFVSPTGALLQIQVDDRAGLLPTSTLLSGTPSLLSQKYVN